jgi:membrane protease YdiL (CAAX protease family)
VVLVLQLVFIARGGWWRETAADRERSTRRLSWLAPSGIAALCLLVSTRGFVDAPGHHFVGLALTCALVGITEEMTFRGVLVTTLRRAGSGEGRTAIISSVLFGFFHLPNIVLGAAVGATLRQVVFTTIMGLVFYAVRRATGRLLPGMVLHGAYDAVLLASVS